MYIFVTIKGILEMNPRFIQSLSDRTTTDFTEFPTARLFHGQRDSEVRLHMKVCGWWYSIWLICISHANVQSRSDIGLLHRSSR